jgi:hypothetical protein
MILTFAMLWICPVHRGIFKTHQKNRRNIVEKTNEEKKEKKQWETPEVETTEITEGTLSTFNGTGGDNTAYS